MSALWQGLTALTLGPRRTPPKYEEKVYILSLNLKISYQIDSLFDEYIDMGERIAGKQDMPSLIH